MDIIQSKKEILDFDASHYDKARKLIIYGTAQYGEIVSFCLRKLGITPDYFADQEGKREFQGIPVLSLSQLSAMNQKEKITILLAVGWAYGEIVQQLYHNGIYNLYSIWQILEQVNFENSSERKALKNAYRDRKQLSILQKKMLDKDYLFLKSVDAMVTERCSLKCEHCSNLMQYYERPENISVPQIVHTINALLEKVDLIWELRVLGGEPFMNSDFYDLIDYYKDNSQIYRIVIYSNATIFPSEQQRRRLQSAKVRMQFSDYGMLSRNLEKWISWCDANNVDCVVKKSEIWHDCGKLEKHNYCNERLKYLYKTCQCKNIPTILRGRLYNCPYAANAVNLGAVKQEEGMWDYLSFEEPGMTHSREEIREFVYEREFLESCDYCKGRNYGHDIVPPYEQIKSPLPYEKMNATMI